MIEDNRNRRPGPEEESDREEALLPRPQTSGSGRQRSTCWDTVERRQVDQSFWERGRAPGRR